MQLIADDIRDIDALEVEITSGVAPMPGIVKSVKASCMSAVVCAGDTPLAVMGLVKKGTLSNTGVPWLLASNTAMLHRKSFLLESPPVIQEMLNVCPNLVNWVHSDNIASIRWLRWLGFTIDPAKPVNSNGDLFHRFHMSR